MTDDWFYGSPGQMTEMTSLLTNESRAARRLRETRYIHTHAEARSEERGAFDWFREFCFSKKMSLYPTLEDMKVDQIQQV